MADYTPPGGFSPHTTVGSQRIAEANRQTGERDRALQIMRQVKAARAGMNGHHGSVPTAKGGGGQRGNPNHGAHGYFT